MRLLQYCTIFQLNLHCALLSCVSFCAEGLAWDWINEKLYWTDYCQDEIEVYDPVSNYRSVLLQTGTSPYSIVVDPGTGYV